MMTEKEFLESLRFFRELKMNKDEWYKLGDESRSDILKRMRELKEAVMVYNKRKRYLDIDPYGEEDWGE